MKWRKSSQTLKSSIALIPKPEKITTKKHNYKSMSPKYIDAKILNKMLDNQLQQDTRKIIHIDQV